MLALLQLETSALDNHSNLDTASILSNCSVSCK